MVAFKQWLGRELREAHGIELVPEQSAEGDSPSNGQAEAAVRVGKAKVRTLRHATERFLGTALGATHPLLPWM
eukprot:7491181-Lingulodinium_polyedra.AAC.1